MSQLHDSFSQGRRDSGHANSSPNLTASQNLKNVIQKFVVKIPNMPKLPKMPKNIMFPDDSQSSNMIKISTTLDQRDLTKRNNSVTTQDRKAHVIRTLKTEASDTNAKLDLRDRFAIWEQVQKIKRIVEKYSYGGVQFPEVLDLRKIINCMERINNTEDTMMTELMNMVIKILTSAVYINPFIFEEFKSSLNYMRNRELDNIRSKCQSEGIPYYSLVRILLREVVDLNDEGATKHNMYTEKIDELENQVMEKDSELARLKAIMSEMMTREDYIQKENEIKELITENDELREEINDYAKTKDELIQEKNVLMKKIDSMHKEMMLMKNFQEHITEDKNSQDHEITKLYDHIEKLRVHLRQFKDAFDKVIVKMSEIKTEVKELRDRYEVATMENERLHVRAAAGFENLTPRPDYAKLVKENFCFDFDFYDKKEKRCLVRTDQTIEQLMKNLNVLSSMANRSHHHIIDGKASADSPKRRNSSMTNVRLNSPKERKSMMATVGGTNQFNKRSSVMTNSESKEKKRTATAEKLINPTIEERHEENDHVEHTNLPVKLQRNPNKNNEYGNYVLKKAEDLAKEAIDIKNAMKAADKDI